MVNDGKMDKINIIHDYEKRVKSYLDRLKKQKTTNSKKILEHHLFTTSKRLAPATQLKYLERLCTFDKMFKKDFDKLTKDDLIKLVNKHIDNNSKYSESTRATFKKILKKFFQWLKDCEDHEYPKEVSWIKTSEKKKKHINQTI